MYTDTEYAVRTILGEAGNQGYTGQLAVANVINNRVQSGKFGDTVSQVVTAPHQFDGFDAHTPVGSDAWNQALAAWNAAQAGTDNTGGATYFANPSLSTADWAKNLNGSNSMQIGDQFFTDNTAGQPFNPSNPADVSAPPAGAGGASVGGAGAGPAGWLSALELFLSNWAVRGAIILLGGLIILAAIWKLADPDGSKTTEVVKQIGTAAETAAIVA